MFSAPRKLATYGFAGRRKMSAGSPCCSRRPLSRSKAMSPTRPASAKSCVTCRTVARRSKYHERTSRLTAPRIERGEWLIEEEHARPASEGAGQRHELPLAAAQRSHVTIGHELQAEAIDHLVGIRARARTIRDVLAHSEVRE